MTTRANFHVILEPWALRSSFRNFQKVDLSNITKNFTIEPFRRRHKQQDDLNKESTSTNSRLAKCISLGATSVHSIFVECVDGEMPISFDTREFLSRACERSSVLTNTDPQLVLRLESACVTEGAQGVLEYGFWVVYLKSFQRKSEALLDQSRAMLMRSWVNFFANVPTPKEPVVDRVLPIVVEAMLFIFTEAFPKSRSLVTDHGFAVYVYRCVYKELAGVHLASVTVDRLRSNHIASARDSDSPRGRRGSLPSQEPQPLVFKPFYHRDAYIAGDEGAHAIRHKWWDPEEDPVWEDDARKQAIRERAAAEAGINTGELNAHDTSGVDEQFVTTLVSPAIHSMSKRRALKFANDPGRRVRVGEYHSGRMVDLRIQPRRTRAAVDDGTKVGNHAAKEDRQAGVDSSTPAPSAPLGRCGTSPASLQNAASNSRNGKCSSSVGQTSEADLLSRTHRLVLAETYAKKREAKEHERFLPPKYTPLELVVRESLKERKQQKQEYEQEKERKARLLVARRGAVQAAGSAQANQASLELNRASLQLQSLQVSEQQVEQ